MNLLMSGWYWHAVKCPVTCTAVPLYRGPCNRELFYPTTASMSPEGPEKWQSFSDFVEVTVLSEQGPSSQGALPKQSPPSFTDCFPVYLCVCVSLHPSGPQVLTWPS